MMLDTSYNVLVRQVFITNQISAKLRKLPEFPGVVDKRPDKPRLHFGLCKCGAANLPPRKLLEGNPIVRLSGGASATPESGRFGRRSRRSAAPASATITILILIFRAVVLV